MLNGGNGAKAARGAGYANSKLGSAKVRARRLLPIPAIQQAIAERTRQKGAVYGPRALQTLLKLMTEGEQEQTRLMAARDVLERFGYRPTATITHVIRDEGSDAELLASIRALRAELELHDPGLVRLPFIDGEVISVEDEIPQQAATIN